MASPTGVPGSHTRKMKQMATKAKSITDGRVTETQTISSLESINPVLKSKRAMFEEKVLRQKSMG